MFGDLNFWAIQGRSLWLSPNNPKNVLSSLCVLHIAYLLGKHTLPCLPTKQKNNNNNNAWTISKNEYWFLHWFRLQCLGPARDSDIKTKFCCDGLWLGHRTLNLSPGSSPDCLIRRSRELLYKGQLNYSQRLYSLRMTTLSAGSALQSILGRRGQKSATSRSDEVVSGPSVCMRYRGWLYQLQITYGNPSFQVQITAQRSQCVLWIQWPNVITITLSRAVTQHLLCSFYKKAFSLRNILTNRIIVNTSEQYFHIQHFNT